MLGLVRAGGTSYIGRQRPLKVAFNIGKWGLSSAVAVVVFRAVTQFGDPHGPVGWAAAAAGAATFGFVSVVLVTVTIALAAGGASLRELPRTASLGLAASFASASLALAAVEIPKRMRGPSGCWSSRCVWPSRSAPTARNASATSMSSSSRTMRATQGAPEFRGAVRELLVAARTMLSADYAEIVLDRSMERCAVSSRPRANR
jgi:hypothetical protein